jgi:hypothetical protein
MQIYANERRANLEVLAEGIEVFHWQVAGDVNIWPLIRPHVASRFQTK